MEVSVQNFLTQKLSATESALCSLGQSGYLIRSHEVTCVIDPYLSNSAAGSEGLFNRLFPVPIGPEELKVDYFFVTHDHLDHLDPETLGPYRHKSSTIFVAPRLACRKLATLGIPESQIRRLDSGETLDFGTVKATGVYAVPYDASVMDTCGYKLEFPNGRSVYHSSDTSMSKQLLSCAPFAEVLLVCINGKWDNLNPHEAVELTKAVAPLKVIPNHYDMMALNTENPEVFRFLAQVAGISSDIQILKPTQTLVWNKEN